MSRNTTVQNEAKNRAVRPAVPSSDSMTLLAKPGRKHSIWFAWGSILDLLVFASSAHCQTDITLRFLDAASGKPIKGISVAVFASDRNEGRQKPLPPGVLKIDKNAQTLKTDRRGETIFHLYYQPGLITLYVDSVGDCEGVQLFDSQSKKFCEPEWWPAITQVNRNGVSR